MALGLPAAGCSGKGSGSPPDGATGSDARGAQGGRGGAGAPGGTGGFVGAGGTAGALAMVDAGTDRSADGSADRSEVSVVPTVTQVRFLQAFVGDPLTGSQGLTTAYDVWTRAADQTWVSIYKALPYGQLTDYLSVSITGGKATLWFVPPGGDPANTPTGTSDVSSLLIASGDTGRHTALAYNLFGQWAVNVISDDNPAATPPAGKANLIFNTAPILEMFAGYGFNYGRVDLCLDSIFAEGRFAAIDPGTWIFSLFDAHNTNCQGPVIVSTPATTYAAGEGWILFGIGDASPNGYRLIPVKLTRN